MRRKVWNISITRWVIPHTEDINYPYLLLVYLFIRR